ncbi:MAG: undecaprenyl-diphosphate phosphatase [Deltaproteobacteria bacterium]|nr:undecaprenyl-diphosphate phosphatase [Deltaproteobacteria bacterium]
MQTLQALFLGFIQGITEFIPVSSDGHLALFERIFDFQQPSLLFNVVLHGGTLLALLIYLRKPCLHIVSNISQNKNIIALIVLANIPTVILGFIGQSQVEILTKDALFTATNLIINGVILTLSFLLFRQSDSEESIFDLKLNSINILKVLTIGLFQGIAILPGISRSGLTILMALFLGFSRAASFEFSFLISIPAISGALLLEIIKSPSIEFNLVLMGLGMFSSFFTGLLALKLLRRSIMKGVFYYFGLYCIVAGVAFLVYLR